MNKFSDKKIEFKKINENIFVNHPSEITKIGFNDIVKSEPAIFVSKIFESAEMAHIYHLQIKNLGAYAGHKALEDYYTAIRELNDEIIEVYQGQYDIITDYEIIDTKYTKDTDKIQYFTDLVIFIKDTRYRAFLNEDTHLHNIVDEMVSTIYRLLYKLKNLK